jgi:hypothetical protein
MTSRLPAFRPQPGSVHLPTNAIVLALGVAGGLMAKLLGLPLPLLLGSLVAVAAAALSGWQPAGRPLVFPTEVRTLAIPILGVSIGSAVGPGILGDLARWWPGLVGFPSVVASRDARSSTGPCRNLNRGHLSLNRYCAQGQHPAPPADRVPRRECPASEGCSVSSVRGLDGKGGEGCSPPPLEF